MLEKNLVQKWIPIKVALEKAKEKIRRRIKKEERSLKFPWVKHNMLHLGGQEWGQMMTVAGLSGAGKTLFMGQLYREIFKLNPLEDFIVVLYNFEMVGERLVIRDAISKTGMSKNKIMSVEGFEMDKEDLALLSKFFENPLYDMPILLIEKPCTPEEYVATNEAIYKKYGKKLLIIGDHSTLFEGAEAADQERLVLADLGKKIMIQKNEGWSTHIILTQMNREIEQASRRSPMSPLNYPDKTCIFGGDGLYVPSDTVLVIHRPYMLKFVGNTYGPDKFSANIEDVYFHYIKLRDGEPTIARMIADFKNMSILDDNQIR